MRKDFKKLLCEEPRSQGSSDNALNKIKGTKKRLQKAAKYDYESWNFPKKESMCGNRNRGTKAFGEHLSPLVRFLRKNVGKNWNKIFSEIRQNCPNDNAVNAHVYQHLWRYVHRNTFKKNNKIHSYDAWSSDLTLYDRGRDNTFYIDTNGCLQRAPRKPKPNKNKKFDIVNMNKQTFVFKNNIWFEAFFKKIPKPKIYLDRTQTVVGIEKYRYPFFKDVYLDVSHMTQGYDGAQGVRLCEIKYGKKIYCYKLKQLNSRELKRYNLKNKNNA